MMKIYPETALAWYLCDIMNQAITNVQVEFSVMRRVAIETEDIIDDFTLDPIITLLKNQLILNINLYD